MKARPSDSRAFLRPYREHVVQVTIRKDQIEQNGFSKYPVLCACAVQPLPKISDPGESLKFHFHLDDWNNVVVYFLEEQLIPFGDFHVLTEEHTPAKGMQFKAS